MVPFAGFSMPLSYAAPPSSGLSPHAHVRTHAGLFDVGHMVQSFFRGPGALAFLESLCPTDLSALSHGEGGLTVLLNDKGGIVDDTIVTKHDDETFYVVTNAGRREEDLALFRAKLADWGAKHGSEHAVEMEVLDGWGLVALQGESFPLCQLRDRALTSSCAWPHPPSPPQVPSRPRSFSRSYRLTCRPSTLASRRTRPSPCPRRASRSRSTLPEAATRARTALRSRSRARRPRP